MQEPQQQQETNSVADVHLGTENIFVLFTVERREARQRVTLVETRGHAGEKATQKTEFEQH